MAVLHPMLTTAIRAARRAAGIINRAALDLESGSVPALDIVTKRRNDFVTEVDHAAENAIIDIIRKAYPDHAILAEESGRSGRANAEAVWIIDPLDGTTNFIHGFPQFAVSIAVEYRGQITQAVVYDPNKNEMFTASRGRGAFMNDKRIRVSRRDQLDTCLIGTGFPFRDGHNLDQYLAQFKLVTEATAGIRRPGAATLDLCYVACGRLDGFWENGLAPWDMAAASLVITEAGGLVADYDGTERYLASGHIVAGAPKVFPSLLELIQRHHVRSPDATAAAKPRMASDTSRTIRRTPAAPTQ